jgi:hypothetical protein
VSRSVVVLAKQRRALPAGLRSWLLIASALAAGALTAALAAGPEPRRAAAASAAAGAFIALAAVAGTSVASWRARAGGARSIWRASVLGVGVRIVFIGGCVALATTFGWFRPVPFVIGLGVFYFGVGLWLVLAERAALGATRADDSRGSEGEEG